MWKFSRKTTHKAVKKYTCDGCKEILYYIENCGIEDLKLSDKDIMTIEYIVYERQGIILAGEDYIKIQGMWVEDGFEEWAIYRSLPIAYELIDKYNLYYCDN
jgi:hypothetical protein